MVVHLPGSHLFHKFVGPTYPRSTNELNAHIHVRQGFRDKRGWSDSATKQQQL